MKRTLSTTTDEQLVVRYAEGENAAFDVLLNRYKSDVYSYIYFTVRNKEVAEDIFQETFVKAIMQIKQGRYTETGRFKSWIMRIAHNLVIDYFRQVKNENTISDDESDGLLLNNKELCDDTIEDELVRSQVLDDVRRLIEFLPKNQKEVLLMRYYQDMSFKEIAEQTGVSINTALGRMRYAVLNLRKLVDDNNINLAMN